MKQARAWAAATLWAACWTAGAAAQPPLPQVVLATAMGEITLELYPDRVPATVENFLRHVNAGFYDGTLIHRVVPDFLVQGGGYTSELNLKTPLYPPVRLESRTGLRNLRGTVAMARSRAPDSATTQFFINLVDNPFLDYNPTTNPTGYAVFGRVIRGMDVVDRIRGVELVENPTDPQADGSPARSLPARPVLIRAARMTEPGPAPGE